MTRAISLHGITPVHPRRPEPSRIELTLVLGYLRGEPIETIVLTEEQALELAEQAINAVRIVRKANKEQR